MTERYQNRAGANAGPVRRGFAITKSDSIAMEAETRAIYVGGSGDLSLLLSGGDTVSLSNVVAGTLLPLRAKRVNSTGTSATSLVGLY